MLEGEKAACVEGVSSGRTWHRFAANSGFIGTELEIGFTDAFEAFAFVFENTDFVGIEAVRRTSGNALVGGEVAVIDVPTQGSVVDGEELHCLFSGEESFVHFGEISGDT